MDIAYFIGSTIPTIYATTTQVKKVTSVPPIWTIINILEKRFHDRYIENKGAKNG